MSDFTQLLLTPPDAIEIRLRIGVVPATDHAQVMVEAFEPSSRAQLSAWARHHVHIADVGSVIQDAVQRVNELLEEYVQPF